jgi:hypothetical protein
MNLKQFAKHRALVLKGLPVDREQMKSIEIEELRKLMKLAERVTNNKFLNPARKRLTKLQRRIARKKAKVGQDRLWAIRCTERPNNYAASMYSDAPQRGSSIRALPGGLPSLGKRR